MSETFNIYQRINSVMGKVSYIKKDAQVSGGGTSYKAVTRDAVVSALREHLVAAGIVVETSQVSGEWSVMRDMNAQPQPVKMGLYRGMYEVRFVNIDNPEDRATVQIEAHASDNGDKAPGKAATYAEKTALLKQFSLETGLNDEERMGIDDIIDQDTADQFGFLVESGDAMELWLFMSQFEPESPKRKALFDSVPYGKKGKIKDGFIDLMADASGLFVEWSLELTKGIESGDEAAIMEYWDELQPIQKTKVWAQLKDDARDYLKARKNNM